MFKNRYKPYHKWIERNIPELSNRGPVYVDRTIRSADNAARPFPSVIRFVGIFAAIFGGQSIADMFFSYGEQRLEYNIVLVTFVVIVFLITSRVADSFVHRKIQLLAESTE